MTYKFLRKFLLFSATIFIISSASVYAGMVGGPQAPNFFNGPNATPPPTNSQPQGLESPPVIPTNAASPQPGYNGIVPSNSVNTNEDVFVPQNNTNTNRTITPH